MMKHDSEHKYVIRINKKIVVAYIFLVLIYFVYMIVGNSWFFDMASLLIFMGALLAVFKGINDMRMKGGTLSSVFIVFYFFGLAMNCLNISALQEPKNLEDVYYFFVGPLIFYLILKNRENKSVGFTFKPIMKINPNSLAIVLYAIYCIAELYMFSIIGIRFTSDEWSTAESIYYTVPGVSGLVGSISWLLLILLPEVKTKYKILFILTTFTTAVLMAKRGDAMRIIIYAMMYVLLMYKEKIFSTKVMLRFCTIILGSIIIFSEWGDYRQLQRGWDVSKTVGLLLESSVENNAVNWIFGYVGINYDVMKQFYIDKPFTGEMQEIFLPLIRIVGDSTVVKAYYDNMYIYGLNGFNAAPFIAVFIHELGPLYIINVAILAILVSVASNVCTSLNIKGGNVLLMMTTAMTFFGNYYLNVNIFYSLLISVLLFGLIDIKNVDYKHEERSDCS